MPQLHVFQTNCCRCTSWACQYKNFPELFKSWNQCCQPPEANIDTNGYEPSKASNDGKQCQARSLTFHICINLKLKWKPTVEKAYCFRPIQWLDSTVETNEKHRKK